MSVKQVSTVTKKTMNYILYTRTQEAGFLEAQRFCNCAKQQLVTRFLDAQKDTSWTN